MKIVYNQNQIPNRSEMNKITTYVLQYVNSSGMWYDYATFNVNIFKLSFEITEDETKERWAEYFKESKPWRFIERVSEETILDGHDHI